MEVEEGEHTARTMEGCRIEDLDGSVDRCQIEDLAGSVEQGGNGSPVMSLLAEVGVEDKDQSYVVLAKASSHAHSNLLRPL